MWVLTPRFAIKFFFIVLITTIGKSLITSWILVHGGFLIRWTRIWGVQVNPVYASPFLWTLSPQICFFFAFKSENTQFYAKCFSSILFYYSASNEESAKFPTPGGWTYGLSKLGYTVDCEHPQNGRNSKTYNKPKNNCKMISSLMFVGSQNTNLTIFFL